MSDEEIKAKDEEFDVPEARSGAESGDEDDTEILDTDIVFDCPHCGHNLVIDYRGAGLQINCVKCGKPALVPIPDGMNISDLDLEPGEILKQLFKTRRDLQKAEQQAAEYLARMEALSEHLNAMSALIRGDGAVDGK